MALVSKSSRLDIGFGDPVHPEAGWAEFPTVLAMASPRIRMYSRTSVVAEKLHAMVRLGRINSRMKDYHDIWFLSRQWSFGLGDLVQSITVTFASRQTSVTDDLEGLGDDYVESHLAMWKNFQRHEPGLLGAELPKVVERLRAFLLPCLKCTQQKEEWVRVWNPETGEWSEPS